MIRGSLMPYVKSIISGKNSKDLILPQFINLEKKEQDENIQALRYKSRKQ